MSKQKAGKSSRWMALGVSGAVFAGTGGFLAVQSASYVPKVWPGTRLADSIDLDGLTSVQLNQKIEDWWAEEKLKSLEFEKGVFSEQHEAQTLEKLGVSLNQKATLKSIKFDTFFDELKSNIGQKRVVRKISIEPIFIFEPKFESELADFVSKNQPPIRPAKARFQDGKIVHEYESNGMKLNAAGLSDAISVALESDSKISIPVEEQNKRVSDSDLEKIKVVYSEFSTTFSTGKVSRSKNIKRAAELIDGTVLLPGEKFSFNDHLGRRTLANGFHVAGVYVSGRHDVDVGGGICQVSTTLYNALLLGDIKVQTRFPHSLPVPYVPLGRDAAVSFPNPDFVFVNSFDTPIAVSAIYAPGKLTFKVLGLESNPREVKFESKLLSSWSRGEKIVHDPNLKYGQRKVVDSGGSGRKVRTWKVVYENGKEVSRTVLSDSTYSR